MPDSPTVVRIAFVDDEEQNYRPLQRRIEEYFEDLKCTARIDFIADPDEAFDCIGHGAQPYHVVVADLLFPLPQAEDTKDKVQDARGLEIIEKAKRRDQQTVVAVITRKVELRKRARDSGADIVLLRGDMLVESNYGGPRNLVNEIHKLLCERGLITAGPELRYDDNDPGIEMVLDDTNPSGATLRLLIADVLSSDDEQAATARLSYVPGGGSGAHVLRVGLERARGSQRTYLFKLSKEKAALARELENARRAFGLYGPTFAVPYVQSNQPASRNGWSAIALVFAEGVTSFQEWLYSSSPEAVPALMNQLFLDRGLIAGYRQRIMPDDTSAHPMTRLRLPAFRRNKVKHAIEWIRHSLGQVSSSLPDSDELVNIVRGFVRNAQIGDLLLKDVPAQLELVEAHGDLHGRNILVSTDDHSRPMIIDLAEFGSHHWAADVARLSVDLVLRCVDPKEKWYRWDNFDTWRRLTSSLGDLVPLQAGPDPHNDGVFAALEWMIEHNEQILIHAGDPGHRWEWNVALAEQFLRSCYSTSLSDPKRALALVAAHDQLLTAREIAPRHQQY